MDQSVHIIKKQRQLILQHDKHESFYILAVHIQIHWEYCVYILKKKTRHLNRVTVEFFGTQE